jgi:hypothetical protein
MVDDDEHKAAHRDLALLLAGADSEDTSWVAALNAHLADMHGIQAASDPVFVHRHLHPL